MRKSALLLALSSGTLAYAGVSVSAPANGSQVSTTVHYVANASTTCANGVSAIGIYTAPFVLAYSTSGSSLNTELTLPPGDYQTVVQAWDNCGGASQTPVSIHVSAGASEVQVTAPNNNANVATQVQYVASSSTSCPAGVAAMGIYTSPGVLAYHSQGANLNTLLTLNPGTYHTVVQEWDRCGGSAYTPITIEVAGPSSGGQVTVTAPQTNTTVSSTVQYVASASSSCRSGVAGMGIYTDAGVLAYTTYGSHLNTLVNLKPGVYHTVVQEWDNCGGTAVAPVTITVGGGSASGVFKNLHQQAGWTGHGLLRPQYSVCGSCTPAGPQITWAMNQDISSPALSGNSTRMEIGGQTAYSDVLWNNHLIGDFSSQSMPDEHHAIVPNLHNFTYDVYFYGEDLASSQAVEFDINQFVNGNSYIWGHECRLAGGHEWDIWDNQAETWHPTGIPCNPVPNAWNHVVLQVHRTSDNHLLFQSITLNGVTAVLNYYETPTPSSWYGVTINYQQDGNYKQAPYSIWLDKLNFTYW